MPDFGGNHPPHILPNKVKCKLADYICQELEDSLKLKCLGVQNRAASEAGYEQNRIALQPAGFERLGYRVDGQL
jgi:hypothetical protein